MLSEVFETNKLSSINDNDGAEDLTNAGFFSESESSDNWIVSMNIIKR